MRNQQQNDGYRFGPSLCTPSTKKKPSKIMQKSRKEWKRSREYFRTSVPNRNNYASERGNDDIAKQSRLRSSQMYDSSKSASVNGQQNKIVTQKMRQIPSDDLTNAQKSRPSAPRPDNASVSPQKNMEKSRPSSSRPDNASVSPPKNMEKSRPSSSRPDNAWVSPQKDIEKSRPSSSRPDNASVSPQKNIEKSRPSSSRPGIASVSPQKNIEKSRPSSSRPGIASFSPQKNTEKSSLFSPRPDNASVSPQKDIEKSGLFSSRPDNASVSPQKDTEKSGLFSSISDNALVSPQKDTEKSRLISSRRNNGLVSPQKDPEKSSPSQFAADSRIDGDMFKSKRKGPFPQEKPKTDEKNGGEEAGNFRLTKRRRYIAIEDEEDDGGDQNLVGVDCGSEEAENCRLTKKRRRYIANEDEEDDGGDQNSAGVEGGTAGLTTQAAIMKDQRTEVSEPFISDSGKLQRYSCLPIDEPIWSGILKVGSKEYVSLAAHLSAKCCERAWKLSRSLKRVVEVTKLSRLEAWPKSFEVSRPTDDNIALYFLPKEMRLDEDLDQLVKEVMENDTVLRAVVGEAEMLIFPSILLPEQHQTFQRKPYLWGVFKHREDKVAIVEEQQYCTGRCAQEEEIEKQPASTSGVQKDGYRVAGLNMAAGLEAPKEAERQGMEQELTSLLAQPNSPHLAEGAARPTSAPTTSAVLPHSTLAVPSGAVFGFIVRQTPRLERLIQEMEREGDVVVAMRGEMIASGLGQPTATG